MPPNCTPLLLPTALLLGLLPIVTANAHSGNHALNPDTTMEMPQPAAMTPQFDDHELENYFRLGQYSAWMNGHIFVMILTWAVLLPLATFFSIAKSRFALPVQVIFFVANAIGLFLGTVYTANTPDLYENNAHHKMGWIFTWFAAAWIILGILNVYASRSRTERRQSGQLISIANMARYTRLRNEHSPPRRWSQDSGQGTERNSGSLFGAGSPMAEFENHPFENSSLAYDDVELDGNGGEQEKGGLLPVYRINRFFSKHAHRVSSRSLGASKVVYTVFERSLVVLGFVAILTGFVTFGGIFQGTSFLNGLAHWVKGGIFFWYGLLTLGRWMGAFADLGWAWNVKPGTDLVPRWKTRMPSAEFVESSVFALYGVTNVWLEHLAAWGDAWAPSDLEHVSITILFFGGGVLGMMIESSWIRDLLSTHIVTVGQEAVQASSTEKKQSWEEPSNYHVPLNPMPALVIMLLGIMMSSHNQESMTSSMIHKQWGQLFVGFALARGCTYLVLYIRPYTSYLPSRPPTEIITSFCLIGGGLIFMASSRDVVETMEYNGLDAMFGFTVTMGVTALLMAWVVLLLAIKGWAARKERPNLFKKQVGLA